MSSSLASGIRRVSQSARRVEVANFAQEREMATPVRSWLQAQKLLVKAEYSSPWGLCDFVGLSFDPRRVRQRLRLRQRTAIGSILRLSLLHRIPEASDGSITIQRLEREFVNLMDRSRLAHEIDQLVAARFIRFARHGSVHKLNGWTPLHRRILAVEVKLSRVQEALAQARSHLRFATEVFVAFPTPLAQRVVLDRRAQLFHSAGVGILAVSDHSCTTVLRPREREFLADPILQAHCVERFWRTAS